MVLEAATTKDIVYMADLYSNSHNGASEKLARRNEKVQSMLCVPIELPPSDVRAGSTAVMQFTRESDAGVRSVPYFDLVASNSLKNFVLQEVLQVRESIATFHQADRQFHALERLLGDLWECT